MALAAPSLGGLGLVRQGRQGKARVGEPDLFCVFPQHLICSLHEHSLMLGNCLPPCFVDTAADDQVMDLGHG